MTEAVAAPVAGPANGRASPLSHELALGVLAALLAVAVAATALVASRRFFLIDDYATQFIPVFREIARLLGQGHYPLLTDRIWNGGALLQEYQYAVFNPVSMLLYLALSRLDDLATAAAVYSLVHIGILAGGAFFLCRVLGCAPRHAFLAAVLAPLSDWIFYWGATNWIPALVSMAWLAWAWGFLALTFRRPGFAPTAAACVALTLLSGWPFADLGLLISILVAAEVLLAAGEPRRVRPAAWVMVALVAGALLAAPAVLPLALYATHTDRGTGPGAWAADVPALLGVGVPYFITHWRFEPSGIRTAWYPMVYVAWFAPLALANADWPYLWKFHATRLVVGAAAAFAALSMFPAFWQFRYMFRFLPYYQFAVLVLASLALSRADEQRRGWSLMGVTAVVAGGVWLAMCQTPPLRHFFVGVGVALAAAAWIGGRLVGRRDLRWTLFALVAGIAIFEGVLWRTVDGRYPRFPNDWSPPLRSAVPGHTIGAGPTRYAIFRPFVADPGPQFWLTFGKDNTALQQPGTSILGYTPMSSQPFYRYFCAGHFGTECDNVVARVTARIPPTNRSVIDLMSVDEIVIQQEKDARAYRAAAGPGWTESRGAAGAWRYRRVHPVGLVSWTSPGVGAAVISRAPTRIVLSARNDAGRPGVMVLARAWYPGWSARLNGAPVVARPLAGLLVSIQLPPRSAGRLDVSFWPSGLTVGLVLAAIGALLIALTAFFPRLINRPASQLEEISVRFWKKSEASTA